MSDASLEDCRRDYRFRMEPANRCESCRHATPLIEGRVRTFRGECVLLNIAVVNVRKSVCPGWQSGWSAKLDGGESDAG